MNWQDLLARYRDFEIKSQKAAIVFHAASRVLRGFPHGLPAPEQARLRSALTTLANSIKGAAASRQSVRFPDDPFHLAVSVLVSLRETLEPKREIDLGRSGIARVPCEARFVLTIAHLEDFLSECGSAPRQQVAPRAVAGPPQTATKRARGPVKVLEGLENKLGLSLTLLPAEREEMNRHVGLRNLIVHAGGRATHNWLEETGRKELTVGDEVPLDEGALERASEQVTLVAGEVLMAIGQACFGRGNRQPRDLLLHHLVIARRHLVPE